MDNETRKTEAEDVETTAPSDQDANTRPDAEEAEATADAAEEAPVEDPEIVRLREENEQLRDQALRALAEVENTRRRAERDLLDEYHGALELPAAELPSAEEVWLRYRASVAHGLAIWMATLSGGDAWQSAEICLALAQRYAAAFVDLDTRAALDAIT